MSPQEIDIINDVVHYKSAYYGTIMVGNPPCPKIPLPHEVLSVFLPAKTMVVPTLESWTCLVAEAQAFHSCFRHWQRALDSAELVRQL